MMESIEFWYWFILAVVLMIIETLAPGTFFLWAGISAGIVGVVSWVVPAISWKIQVILFAIMSIVTILVSRRYLAKHPIESDQPTLNRRGAQYVGRTFVLENPIENGRGKIRVDDTTWKIEGEDLPAGAKIKVSGVDGTMLRVEKAE